MVELGLKFHAKIKIPHSLRIVVYYQTPLLVNHSKKFLKHVFDGMLQTNPEENLMSINDSLTNSLIHKSTRFLTYSFRHGHICQRFIHDIKKRSCHLNFVLDTASY